MEGTAYTLMFFVLAAVMVGSALAVVLLRNIVHSALFLALAFIAMAGLYVMLHADFLAAVQILIYAGAVAILIVFGVMLTQRGNMKDSNLFNKQKLLAALVALATFVVVAIVMVKTGWNTPVAAPVEDSINQIATMMLNEFVIPFEIAAVLILAAMIGAIVLAKGVSNR